MKKIKELLFVLFFVSFFGILLSYAQTKPSWLLIWGKDVSGPMSAVVVEAGKPVNLLGFEIKSSASDPLIIMPSRDGTIIYRKGKGEITKIDTGERVVLPLPEQ